MPDDQDRSTASDPEVHGGADGAGAPLVTAPPPPGPSDPAATDAGAAPPVDPGTVAAAPELLANSFGEWVRGWGKRMRGGESGALPIILGLVVIVVIFQVQQSKFLSAGNIVNLLVQAAFFVLLGLAEIFALLLAEIDLSTGFVAAVGGATMAALVSSPYSWPWWAAVIVGLVVCAVIGTLQGVLITRLHLPSFVVTLAGLLGWSGVLIWIFDVDKGSVGGVISIQNREIYDLVNGNLTPAWGWIILAAAVGVYAFFTVTKTQLRRSRGLTAPPPSVTVLTIAVVAVAGVVLVLVCNVNRGTFTPLRGVPYVVPFVVLIIAVWSWFLGRTRAGRYIYAIGGSPEAARRAGIKVEWIRTLAFTLSGLTAGLAGLVYDSRLASISVGFDGGTYVLYAVAAAVIGGTSLLGGRGKAVHALLGGLVIAAVYNGLGLLGIGTAGTEIATALVLLAAATVDSLVRRRGAAG